MKWCQKNVVKISAPYQSASKFENNSKNSKKECRKKMTGSSINTTGFTQKDYLKQFLDVNHLYRTGANFWHIRIFCKKNFF